MHLAANGIALHLANFRSTEHRLFILPPINPSFCQG